MRSWIYVMASANHISAQPANVDAEVRPFAQHQVMRIDRCGSGLRGWEWPKGATCPQKVPARLWIYLITDARRRALAKECKQMQELRGEHAYGTIPWESHLWD